MSINEDLTIAIDRVTKVEEQIMKLAQETKVIKQLLLKIQRNSLPPASVSWLDYSTNDNAKRIKHEFTFEGDYAVVYTDGACEKNGKIGAKAGIGVWFGVNHPLNISAPVIGRATNNTAEIQACIAALRVAEENNIKKLCIKTDSQFVINAMTTWIKKWKNNNWTLSSGGEVKNKEDFMILDELCARMFDVKWVHISGHQGIVGNEGADKLAVQGANAYKTYCNL